ncbi:MAG TPA: hypothetical protein VJ840_13945 [Gemmatimonadaceae bacterium]|nr:hypothetical protein [Gemmatimonadaceae bacterium]
MKRQFRGAAVAAAPFLIGSAAHAQAYTAPRNAVVNAAGARLVEVEAGAGSLRVEGKQGLSQVQVTGTARASSQGILNEIRLIAERRGDRVFIKADIPEHNGYYDNYDASLDLVVEVPQGMNADIADGSGDTKIYNVGELDAADGSGELLIDGAQSVRVTDGSGSLTIENVRGDVRVNDGSGEIDVRNVAGSFTVESDGSGGISATDVRGSVVVRNDGSGGIDVSKVGKDFRVENKGSGNIDYADVTGSVDIPDRRGGRHNRYRE